MRIAKFLLCGIAIIVLFTSCSNNSVINKDYSFDFQTNTVMGAVTQNLSIDSHFTPPAERDYFEYNLKLFNLANYEAYFRQIIEFDSMEFSISPSWLSVWTSFYSHINRIVNVAPVVGSDYYDYADFGDEIFNSLDFLSKEDAKFMTVSVLTDLGIAVTDEIEVYAFTHSFLSELENELYSAAPPKEKDGSIIPRKNNWSKDDDIYIVFLHQAIGDLPLFRQSVGHPDTGNSTNPPYISFCISKRGFENVDIGLLYELTEKGCKINEIISIENAMDSVTNMFNQIIIGEETSITSIELCYAPSRILDDTSRGFLPCWIFTLDFTMSTGTGVEDTVVVNALNGEIIYPPRYI